MDSREEYEKIRKKYKKLPEWKWIKGNFKVKTDDETHVLESVRSAISEKISVISKELLDPVISGGREYTTYLERRMFTTKEIEELFKIFKVMQEYGWSSTEIWIEEFSEKEYAEWIAEFKKEWDGLKPKIIKFCKKVSRGWKDFKKPEQNTAYHG